jgi:hypothetical protein
MAKKSSGQRAYEAGFRAGRGTPKKKKPKSTSGGGYSSGSSRSSSSSQYSDGNTGWGGDNRYTGTSHGTDSQDRPVTVAFGRAGTSREGHTLIRDGHASSPGKFYGPNGVEEHDHYDGRGGGTERGKYSG